MTTDSKNALALGTCSIILLDEAATRRKRNQK